MLKLNKLALCALALLPTALAAQAPVTSAAQTQTAAIHREDEAAIEQVMKQYHAAILAMMEPRSPACSCPTPISG